MVLFQGNEPSPWAPFNLPSLIYVIDPLPADHPIAGTDMRAVNAQRLYATS